MNKPIRSLLISASIAAAAQAAPFMAVGDGAELFITGAVGVRADDNIELSKNEKDDIIFDFAPGIELTFGKNAQTQGALTLSHIWSFYADNDDFNTNLFQGDFVTKFDDGKSKMGFYAGYHELNQNTAELRGLIRRDLATIGANGEVNISEVTGIGAAVDFRHEDYKPSNYVDSNTLSVPFNFYYKWTPKVDLSLGYTYRDYEAKNIAPDSTDHFFNVGARGEFTPKLTGRFAVGYTQRRISGLGNRDLLGLDASFAYELTPKSTFQFGASNDFGTSPTGEQQKNFVLNGLIITKLTEEWSVNAGASYRRIGYGSRTDDYWEGNLGAAYVVNANLRIVGAYVYRTYKTDLVDSEFNNNVFSIAANLRY